MFDRILKAFIVRTKSGGDAEPPKEQPPKEAPKNMDQEKHVKKWTAIGRSTEPADRPKAEAAIQSIYAGYGIYTKPKIIWCDSPLSMAYAAILRHMRELIKNEDGDGITAGVLENDLLDGNVCASIQKSLMAGWDTDPGVESGMSKLIKNTFESAYSKNAAVKQAVEQERGRMCDVIQRGIRQVIESPQNNIIGSVLKANSGFEPQWATEYAAAYDWAQHEHDNRLGKTPLGTIQLAQSAGPVYACVNICWVSERPTQLHLDNNGDPHNDKGPAIVYPDGWKIWNFNRVLVNEKIIMRPHELTAEEADAETNAEVRRVMIERMGHGRYLEGAKLIDADYEGAKKGAAPRCLLQDKRGNKWLVGTDGSTKRVYYMPVPQEVETCRQAHEAICGFDESKIINKS